MTVAQGECPFSYWQKDDESQEWYETACECNGRHTVHHGGDADWSSSDTERTRAEKDTDEATSTPAERRLSKALVDLVTYQRLQGVAEAQVAYLQGMVRNAERRIAENASDPASDPTVRGGRS